MRPTYNENRKKEKKSDNRNKHTSLVVVYVRQRDFNQTVVDLVVLLSHRQTSLRELLFQLILSFPDFSAFDVRTVASHKFN